MCSPPHIMPETLPRDEGDFKQMSKACVYGGSSMLFAEKNMKKTSINERLITRRSNTIESKAQQVIAQVNISLDEIIDMRVVPQSDRDALIIIVVATDGRTFLIPITT